MISKSNPLVSICMITYNHELYISEAIEGVMMQRCNFEFELVIGEDFSTDNTLKICKESLKKYSSIRLISSDANVGMIENFIRTINACTGKYLAFCEGDDYWIDPEKLQKQVNFLEQNSDYGMVYTRYMKKKAHSGEIEKTYPFQELPSGDIYCDYLLRSFIGTATVMIRKELSDKYFSIFSGFALSWPMGDRPLWQYISSTTKVGLINDYTAVYRRNVNSVTSFRSMYDQIEFFKRSYDIRFYFSENVRAIPENFRQKMLRTYNSELLRLYSIIPDHTNSRIIYNELKNKYGLTTIDILRYLGTKNYILRYITGLFLRLIILMRK